MLLLARQKRPAVTRSRTTVLAVLFVALLALAALLLGAVFGTVVFAATVAYLLVPLHQRVEAHGLSPWWASAATATLPAAREPPGEPLRHRLHGRPLTVGPVGIIAGPLVVALAAETATLLAQERQKNQASG